MPYGSDYLLANMNSRVHRMIFFLRSRNFRSLIATNRFTEGCFVERYVMDVTQEIR